MNSDIAALNTFLAAQTENPKLHVNGSDYPFALLAVDYGQPKGGVSISTDKGNELTSLMRNAAKSLLKRKGSVRVNFDNHHGVFYASLSS